MERLREISQRRKVLQLINGLLIGLSIKSKSGHTFRLAGDSLRLFSVGYDQHGEEHLIAVWGQGFVDLKPFEALLDDIEESEWLAFTANIVLNELNDKPVRPYPIEKD